MTAAFLQSELTTLISDSKRKNNEIKSAAEKSLAELRAISVTSEAQLAGDLIRKPHFIEPFLLACKSQNVKLASTGAACLQRLVASTAISRLRLPHLLEAFENAVSLALEVQLKVLQTLPSLLQLYARDLHSDALSKTLSLSADLSNSKSPIVSNTAGATFQQLVSTVFEAATFAKNAGRQSDIDREDALQSITDALSVYKDLCVLLTDGSTKFVRLHNLLPASILGTLENLLAAHGSFILTDAGACKVSGDSLIPGLCGLVENSTIFGIVARALRIIFIVTSQHLDLLTVSLGEALKTVLKIVDRVGNHKWKRILGLEFFRGLCSDFESLSKVFALYDLQDEAPDIVSSLMASLVRTTSEDPSLIGLGRQSTVPTTKGADTSRDATSVVDVPGSGLTLGNVAHAAASSAGISTEWSTLTTPCLDQFDRSTPPEIPETYVYTLVLGCSSAFSDGLSKFVMPLSVPSRKSTRTEGMETEEMNGEGPKRTSSVRNVSGSQKYQQLINPLHRKHLTNYPEIETYAKMIEVCWPAILASCSTFLNAALDSHFYHILVRTVQKLTQVAGVMELLTPRDALLTTLAKVSVPPNALAILNALYGTQPALLPESLMEAEDDTNVLKSPIPSTPRQSIDIPPQSLNLRNLLCLRALLNLGIALGPTMSQSAWMIVLQPVAQVEALMSVSPNSKSFQTANAPAENNEGTASITLAGEISAVDIARRRLFDSTKSYTDSAFQQVCQALLKMIEDVVPMEEAHSEKTSSENQRPKAKAHISTRSISGAWTKTVIFDIEVQFVLKTIGRLASINLDRFGDHGDAQSSWNLIVSPLLRLQCNSRLQPQLRLLSTNIIDGIIVESSRQRIADITELSTSSLLRYGLPALEQQIRSCTDQAKPLSAQVDLEIIRLMLSALENVIGNRGESFKDGWRDVFRILKIVVGVGVLTQTIQDHDQSLYLTEIQTKLYPSAFKVVQLVVSDFLSMLDEQSLRALLNLFEAFEQQKIDLNMSLTTIALFWNVSTSILGTNDCHMSIPSPSQHEMRKDEMDLWQVMTLELSLFCKDARADVRNAALRMLSKILEASIETMSSKTLNSCIRFLLLPLLNDYQDHDTEEDDPWHASFVNTLEDLTHLVQKHTELLTEDETFAETWLETLNTLGPVLKRKNLRIISAVFNSVAAMIVSFSRSDNSAKFSANRMTMGASWSFWNTSRTTAIASDVANIDAIAAQMRVLLQIAVSNFDFVAECKDVTNIIKAFITDSIFLARHDQYTIDINKLSAEQDLAMQIMSLLQRMLPTHDMQYTQYLISLIEKIVAERMHMPSKAIGKVIKMPTAIALATTSIKKLTAQIQAVSNADQLFRTIPIKETVTVSAILTATKTSNVAVNNAKPLWQVGTTLGCTVMTTLKSYITISAHHQPPPELLDSVNTFIMAILSAPYFATPPEEQDPANDGSTSNSSFDVLRLQELHAATHTIFTRHQASKTALKTYILHLFHHSLAPHPRYDDFPNDLNQSPLENIFTVRRGSIRRPDFPARSEIQVEVLASLLSLVSCADAAIERSPGEGADTGNHERLVLEFATIAAPYVLLRLVHSLKTFLADQPLRYLTPPPARLLADLNLTLSKCLALRVYDRAFAPCAAVLGCNAAATVLDDGKTHLRILYSFVARFEEYWRKLPRLKRGHAWQDRREGRDIEKNLGEWRQAISQGWRP